MEKIKLTLAPKPKIHLQVKDKPKIQLKVNHQQMVVQHIEQPIPDLLLIYELAKL